MALDFDGATQYIQIAQTKDLPIYNEVTYSICGWVKAPAQTDKRFFSESSTTSNSPILLLGSGYTDNKKIRVFIRNDASVNMVAGLESTNDFFDNNWHHFCWVDDNGNANLYIDGTLDTTDFSYSRSGTFTMNRSALAAVIRASLDYFLDGELFDIRCYNRCITPNEIAEIYYKRGADKICYGLVGRWRLDGLPSEDSDPLTLDAMDSTSGWSATNGAISLNTTTYIEGGAALSLSKTTTTKNWSLMSKDIATVDLTGKIIELWIYIKNSTALNKISSIELSFGQDTANRYGYRYVSLKTGWNFSLFHVDDYSVIIGSPTKTNVDTIVVVNLTVNNSDTLATDDVIFDLYQAVNFFPNSICDLSGNGNHGTPYNITTHQDSPHRLRRGVLIS